MTPLLVPAEVAAPVAGMTPRSLYSMGVPLETIADILGHSSSRITADLYRHRVAQLQQDAADKMQAVLG